METQTVRTGPRSLEDAKRWMHAKADQRVHPLGLTDLAATHRLIDELDGLDGESWARAWRGAGEAAFAQAETAERADDLERARELFRQSYGFFFLGRFPCPNHPAKLESYARERDAYLRYGRLLREPIERVAISWRDGGEDRTLVFYVRRPVSVARPSVVVMWGGVDAWKEEMTELSAALLEQGFATVAMDNVGTGESPLTANVDAERQFLPVFDWVAAQGDLDGARPLILGRSFGGYWATKLAHLYPERFVAAVNWGGGAHHMFQRGWVEQSRYPDSYLMELVATRSRMLGAKNDDEYISGFARLSLIDQGLLDRHCAPLLLINGRHDRQCPVEDMFLLMEHGDPKSVRFMPGGHMGFGPDTVPTIVRWLRQQQDAKGRPS